MKKIIFDKRWEGRHGIGRFSSEISKRIDFKNVIKIRVKPVSPFDIFITPWYLIFNDFIYFTPGFNAPWFFIKRAIVTIHDLNHIDIKGNDSLLKRIYYKFVLKRACRKSLAIFTVSEFSKNRIVEWSGADSSKITVVNNGVSSFFKKDGEAYKPGYDYFFCVSNRKEHKNEFRLVEAYSLLRNREEIKLLFTGEPTKKLMEYISAKGVEGDVLFSGFLSDEALACYYRGAKALLMPSLYEGFGLPVIEAMACGIPTLVSNTTALGEIGKDCSILVDPMSIPDIINGLQRIISDSDHMKHLSKLGLERAKSYTWDNTSKIITKTLTELL